MKKLLLLLLLVFSFTSNAQFIVGKCIRVVDGDTYIFATAKDTLKIRDAYMNTPEPKNSACSKEQFYSKESSEKAKELLLNSEFKIKIIGTDVYGRTLAYAILNDVGYYHRYMIKNGFAWSFRTSGINYRIQESAKKNKVGLWNFENPINPSDWLREYSTHRK